MTIIERGSGTSLILIPGLQGRWEYVEPTVNALSRTFRVLTFSLAGERGWREGFDPERGLDNYVDQVLAIIERTRVKRPVICGISFGGLVAIRFAATHPEITGALVLASTPGPQWRVRPRHLLYARVPLIFGPLFLAETPFRLRAELLSSCPSGRDRRRFLFWQLRTLLMAPLSVRRMAYRAQLMTAINLLDDCARISAPTLVVTGEPQLDHVVPVTGTSEYTRLIRGARTAVMSRTGHLGSITRPEEFLRILRDFLSVVLAGDVRLEIGWEAHDA